jgi:hypothetical protein
MKNKNFFMDYLIDVFVAFIVMAFVPPTRCLSVSVEEIEVTETPLTFDPETTRHGLEAVPRV